MMKKLKFTLLSAFFVLIKSQKEDRQELAVIEAIKGVMEHHFVSNEPKIDLYFSGVRKAFRAECSRLSTGRKKTCPQLSVDIIVRF
jgi:hypothetical protein